MYVREEERTAVDEEKERKRKREEGRYMVRARGREKGVRRIGTLMQTRRRIRENNVKRRAEGRRTDRVKEK